MQNENTVSTAALSGEGQPATTCVVRAGDYVTYCPTVSIGGDIIAGPVSVVVATED